MQQNKVYQENETHKHRSFVYIVVLLLPWYAYFLKKNGHVFIYNPVPLRAVPSCTTFLPKQEQFDIFDERLTFAHGGHGPCFSERVVLPGGRKLEELGHPPPCLGRVVPNRCVREGESIHTHRIRYGEERDTEQRTTRVGPVLAIRQQKAFADTLRADPEQICVHVVGTRGKKG